MSPIRSRLPLLARAVATGVIATLAFRGAVVLPLQAGMQDVSPDGWLSQWVARNLTAALAAMAPVAAGWAVARCHRPRGTAMVVAYVAFLWLWDVPRSYALVMNALGHERYLPALLNHGLDVLIATLGVLVGGCVIGRASSNSSDEVLVRTSSLELTRRARL